jgi:hypothetical protein
MADSPPIVRTSAAELYDAHVLKNYARPPLTLVRGQRRHGLGRPGPGLPRLLVRASP